jgi:hypothetical protein
VTEPPRPLRVKRPTRTGDQVRLNGELRMRGGILTFFRCFQVADHGEHREVVRIAYIEPVVWPATQTRYQGHAQQ